MKNEKKRNVRSQDVKYFTVMTLMLSEHNRDSTCLSLSADRMNWNRISLDTNGTASSPDAIPQAYIDPLGCARFRFKGSSKCTPKDLLV